MKKSENKTESEQKDITISTRKKSKKIECKGIKNKKTWAYNCPSCDKAKIYTHRGKYNLAVSNKSKCQECYFDRGRGEECGPFERFCPDCNKKISYSRKDGLVRAIKNNRLCNCCKFKGDRSIWFNNIQDNHFKRRGTKHTIEAKRKMRKSAIYRIEKLHGPLFPNFNIKSCDYFEWLNKWNGWNGRYALNGKEFYIKELGYWVDYYEPSVNIVIEWDESRHYVFGQLKKRDIDRMSEIKKFLNCKFYRYNEMENELREYI
jgi:hypothetical protein